MFARFSASGASGFDAAVVGRRGRVLAEGCVGPRLVAAIAKRKGNYEGAVLGVAKIDAQRQG